MNFGDILNDWDKIKKDEVKRKRESPESPKANPDAPLAPARPPSPREQVLAYMNRYGTPDKDSEIDQEEAQGRAGQEERDRLKALSPEASIDLHGKGVERAQEDLRLFLDDCLRRGYRKVLIVHGKGNHSEAEPVLKKTVLRFIERYPHAGRSGPADKGSGGSGATWLILRKA